MSQETSEQRLALIESRIGRYPDFPKKGILFRDIMPIFNEPELLESMLYELCNRLKAFEFDRILGIESRGFLIAPLIANQMRKPFTPIRKKGKLPGEIYSIDYELEYGKDSLEVQKSSLPKGSKCLIVDDLIATGGSASASKTLVEMSGSQVTVFAFVVELKSLKGKDKLGDIPSIALFSY